MSQDVLEQLQSKDEFLLAKAIDNTQLCQFFMGILGRTIWESHKYGYDIFKVFIHTPTLEGSRLRAKVEFNSGRTPDLNFLGRVDGIEEFVNKKSVYMAKVIQKNRSYINFLNESCQLLETYALKKGIKFSEIEIRHGFLSTGNIIVLELI